MKWREFLPGFLVAVTIYTLIRLWPHIWRPYIWWEAIMDVIGLTVLFVVWLHLYKRGRGQNIIDIEEGGE